MIDFDLKINKRRIIDEIEYYATFGKNEETGGITRPSFSEPDIILRDIYIKELEELGLEVEVDAISNIWGKLKGDGSKKGSIIIGSHLDTVPNGGKYDGALGVLIAKEIIRTMVENNVSLQHDLEIVSFAAEESNDFGLSTLGSRTFVEKLKKEDLYDVTNSKGEYLRNAVQKAGGNLENLNELKYLRKEKKAFVELHIEQGKRLEKENVAIGIVDSIVGTHRYKITVEGVPNHSGTTMMEDRNDALTTASEMILAVETICREEKSDLVGTVGRIHVQPNAVNIIPGKAVFYLEIRSENLLNMQSTIRQIEESWTDIVKKRNVKVSKETILEQSPIVLDDSIVSMLQETAERMKEPYLTIPSMAVHDAAHIASIAKTAMVFVKSIGGISHSPKEYSTPEDIKKAANFLLQSLLYIDKNLS